MREIENVRSIYSYQSAKTATRSTAGLYLENIYYYGESAAGSECCNGSAFNRSGLYRRSDSRGSRFAMKGTGAAVQSREIFPSAYSIASSNPTDAQCSMKKNCSTRSTGRRGMDPSSVFSRNFKRDYDVFIKRAHSFRRASRLPNRSAGTSIPFRYLTSRCRQCHVKNRTAQFTAQM